MPFRQLLLFFGLGLLLSLASIFWLDQKLAPLTLVSGEPARAIWAGITQFGNSTWMALLVLGIWAAAFALGKARPHNLAWLSMRKKAALVFAAVAAPGIAVMAIKFLVGRARPYMEEAGFFPFTYGVDYASWPSGHTTTAFAFAAAAGMAMPALRWPLFILAAATGYSRMALGVHYLGDVIAGATLGTVGALLVYHLLLPKPRNKT